MSGRYALLAGLFVLTAIMGQLISNTATALIVIPIGIAAAAEHGHLAPSGADEHAVAAAGAFLTPDRDADQPDGDGAGRL